MNNKRKKIIFIYEGVKAEENLLNNMVRIFFSSKTDVFILNCPAEGNIYMLWARMKKDEFNTDVVNVLKEMSPGAKKRLNGFKASDFSEIYLFFDYDGHNNNIPKKNLNKDILGEMLKTFNNETEFGKLYVSYPMIESIKEINIKEKKYNNLFLSLDEMSKYKGRFNSQSDFNNYNCLNERQWLIACHASQKSACLLVTYKSSCTYEYFIHNLDQEAIYFYQKLCCINNGRLLWILNCVPLFLLEYFKEDFWNKAVNI